MRPPLSVYGCVSGQRKAIEDITTEQGIKQAIQFSVSFPCVPSKYNKHKVGGQDTPEERHANFTRPAGSKKKERKNKQNGSLSFRRPWEQIKKLMLKPRSKGKNDLHQLRVCEYGPFSSLSLESVILPMTNLCRVMWILEVYFLWLKSLCKDIEFPGCKGGTCGDAVLSFPFPPKRPSRHSSFTPRKWSQGWQVLTSE